MVLLASCGNSVPTLEATSGEETEISAETVAGAANMTAEFTPDAALKGQIVYGNLSERGARPYQAYLSMLPPKATSCAAALSSTRSGF